MNYEYVDFSPLEQNKITALRKQGLFVFHLRDQENGFTIERKALINRIGFLVTDTNILGDKEYITDEEFSNLHGKERRLCNYER